jgi:hypothetical protein
MWHYTEARATEEVANWLEQEYPEYAISSKITYNQ